MIDDIKDLPRNERIQFLQDNADTVEVTRYMKPLGLEDLDFKRESLTENHIKLADLEEEKKSAMDGFKGQMNPLINSNKQLLKEIRTRQEEVDGTLYHVANHESGFMETYDEHGDVVATRKLRPSERQKTIFNLSSKTGTNN